jgi:hypothetical protein
MRAITCPSCGGAIGVKAVGYTVTVACQYCGSLLDVTQPDVAIIKEYHEKIAQLPLPLGSRGVLFGVEWEAIGFQKRSVGDEVWGEYLLFNPYAGYRWLVHDGGWMMGQTIVDVPRETGVWGQCEWRGSLWQGEDEPVTVTTLQVLGEFYWRVQAGEMWVARSYDAGAQSLSREWNAGEVQWTHLVPVPGRWIDGFTRPGAPRPEPKPAPKGPWLHDGPADLWTMAALAVASVMVALALLVGLSSGGAGDSAQAQVVVDGPAVKLSVGPLKLERAYQFVTVKAAASPFSNRWVDLDYRLVNRATQQAISASGALEYYEGSDSDGAWSEGSHEHEQRFAQVPAGQYDLLIEAQAHRWGQAVAAAPDAPWSVAAPEKITLGFLVEQGGMPWGVWWLIVVCVAGPVLVVYAYRASRSAVYGENRW